MSDPTLKRYPTWFRYRRLSGILGFALMVFGQAWMSRRTHPPLPSLKAGEWLTDVLHLAVPNIDNVLYGLPFLLAGGALLWFSMRGIPLMPAEREFRAYHPPGLRILLSAWIWLLTGLVTFAFLMMRLNAPSFQPFHAPLWVISLTLIGIAVAIWDLRRGIELSPKISRKDLLWMAGLLLVGLLIGVFRLQGLPEGLIGDEGNFWGIARDIAIGKFNPSIFAVGVYTFPVFSSIFPAWFIKIFGISLWGWRFSSVLIGLMTVPPLYLLARETFNRKTAITASVVLITSPYFIAFSRLGYNNIQALFVTTLALYWLYLGFNRKSHLYLFLSGCAAGLGFYVYFAARMALVIALLLIFLLWIGRRVRLREAVVAFALVFAGFALFVTPHIRYAMFHDPQALSYKTFESVFFNTFNGLQFYSEQELYEVAPPFEVNGNQLFYHPRIYLELITRGFIRTMLAFQKPWLVSEHYIAFPLAGSIGTLFYLIGLVWSMFKIRQPRSQMLLLWFFINVFGLSALNTVPPRHTHMVAIIPALALLTTIGMQAFSNTMAAIFRRLNSHRTALLAFVAVIVALGGLYDYFIKMPPEYRPHPDQIVLWTGLGVKNESLVYVYSNPIEKEFMPTMVTPFRKEIVVEALSFDEFQGGKKNIPLEQPTIVLFPPDIKEPLWVTLQSQWGAGFISKTFYSTDGTPVLAAGMNTPFVFERDKYLSTVLSDTFAHPSLLILLLLLCALAVIIAFFPLTWMTTLQQTGKKLAKRFKFPEDGGVIRQPEPLEEEIFEWPEEDVQPGEVHTLVPLEPPEWAQAIFPSAETSGNTPLRIQARRIKKSDSSELYLKVVFPRLNFPQLRLPWSKQTTGQPEFSLPTLRIPGAPLLMTALGLAIASQITIQLHLAWVGVLGYLASLGVLIYWGYQHPKWRAVLERQAQITPPAEKLVFLALLMVMAYLRFYDLGYRVYGLEADETKWTVQSWLSTILGVDRGEFHGMHYIYVPVDFWVRSLFLRLFGLDFLSARIESAILSLISIAFLYFIVRLLTSSPATALFSALLYGFSFYELNASHQALHNTTIEPWIMGSLFFLLWGIQKRKLWIFQVTGFFLALGMLTYETFYPTALLALLYLFGWAVYDLIRRRETLRNWLISLGLVLWPILLAYFGFAQSYMKGRQHYIFGWLWETTAGRTDLSLAGFFLQNIVNLLKSTFVSITHVDSLLFWDGPLVAPVLLPFVVIGFAYNLWNLKRRYYAFIPLWYLIQTIFGPVLTGSTWPRVMYTALGPLMIWGAMGLWTALAALRSWLEQSYPRMVRIGFLALVILILINNYSIFSTRLLDPRDRQKRRELADLTSEAARDAQLLLFPYIPYMGDSVEVESHVILFSVAGVKQNELSAENLFKQVEFNQLLPALWENKDVPGIAVIFDKSYEERQEERDHAINIALTCYPQTVKKSSGRFFDIYAFSFLDLNQPACYQPPAPILIKPEENGTVANNTQPIFGWETGGNTFTSFILSVERKLEEVLWLEAEEEFSQNGWHPESAFADGFSGDGFLLDDWQAGTATYTFNAPMEGPYRIWVRAYKRVSNDQHNYLSLAGQTVEFAQNGSPENAWAWSDLGTFNLPAGPSPVNLSRAYGIDDQYAVFIDAVVISRNLDFNPEQDDIWQTALITEEIPSSVPEYTLPGLLPPGEYRWSVRIFDGDRMVDSSGLRGVQSPTSTFIIKTDEP